MMTTSQLQAQNNRELSFRKGDVIYIKKQVDNNWYEGERHATVGIFPVTYVEILPSGSEGSTLQKKEANTDGQAKAKFNFTAQTPMELSLIKGRHVPPVELEIKVKRTFVNISQSRRRPLLRPSPG